MIFFHLLLLLGAPCAAQNLSEPQYQLTGKDYSKEAAAIQQMLYNDAAAVKGANAAIAANTAAVNAAGTNAVTLTGNNPFTGRNTFSQSTTTVRSTILISSATLVIGDTGGHIDVSTSAANRPAAICSPSGSAAKITGTDVAGTLETNGGCTTAAMTFATPYVKPPVCLCQNTTEITSAVCAITSPTTTGITFSIPSSPSSGDVMNYWCVGMRPANTLP